MNQEPNPQDTQPNVSEEMTALKEAFFDQSGPMLPGMPSLKLSGPQRHQLEAMKPTEFLEAISALYLHMHRKTRSPGEKYLDDDSYLGSLGKLPMGGVLTLRDVFEHAIMTGFVTSEDDTQLDPQIIRSYMTNKIGLLEVVRSIDDGFSQYLFYAQKACVLCGLISNSIHE